ncbi:MAG: hypothetical protein J4F31_00850 [Flavobacteriales bacterium]|nr:hypothetical protein [Flavobacteriales bacterium]
MEIQLIKGRYSQSDALELVKCLVDCKIRFLEETISTELAEEDMKMRERRIVELQNQLNALRSAAKEHGAQRLSLSADIQLN